MYNKLKPRQQYQLTINNINKFYNKITNNSIIINKMLKDIIKFTIINNKPNNKQ